MKFLSINRRMLALLAVIVPLLALLIYVALRSGPLAPIPVTVTTVESRSITPALFGIGTVEARYTYRIGPTVAGRVKRVDVQVGDRVQAGQLLGEMDPVDLDDRIAAQDAALKRAEAAVLAAEAQVREALARKTYAETQASRYEQLLQGALSERGNGRGPSGRSARWPRRGSPPPAPIWMPHVRSWRASAPTARV